MQNTKRRAKQRIALASALLAAATLAGAAEAGGPRNTDAGTPTATVGERAPEFALKDLDGNVHRLSDLTAAGKTVVLEWFNPNCPYVKKHHERFSTMNDLYEMGKDHDVVWLAINSARAGHPTGDPDLNRKRAEQWKIQYPILLDTTGEVGHAYGAKATPHMFVIDSKGILAYSGAIDDDDSARTLGTTNYVRDALTSLWAGETIAVRTSRAYGCSVKY